jgi:hypothetical protein
MFDSADIFRLSGRYICTDALTDALLIPLMSAIAHSPATHQASPPHIKLRRARRIVQETEVAGKPRPPPTRLFVLEVGCNS